MGAVMPPEQTTQDPDAAVVDIASVAAIVELAAAAVELTAAPAVELAAAAAAVVLTAAAAVVAAVVVAMTVVATSGQHILSNALIRAQIGSLAPKTAASVWMPPQVLLPSVTVSASTLIPPGQTEHLSSCCAWTPVERMATTAKMENFISVVSLGMIVVLSRSLKLKITRQIWFLAPFKRVNGQGRSKGITWNNYHMGVSKRCDHLAGVRQNDLHGNLTLRKKVTFRHAR